MKNRKPILNIFNVLSPWLLPYILDIKVRMLTSLNYHSIFSMPTTIKERILARKSAWNKNALRTALLLQVLSHQVWRMRYWCLRTGCCQEEILGFVWLYSIWLWSIYWHQENTYWCCIPQPLESHMNNWKWIYFKLVRIGSTVLYYIKNIFWCQIRLASVRKPLLVLMHWW